MNSRMLPAPTPEQLAWADCEIGVIIHMDVQVFEPSYHFRERPGYTPSPSVFNPTALDTDQWIDAAASAGAKYAVFVAKHCSGFSMWPTSAHGYSVASAPWRRGKGDVVKDFFASCESRSIKPGLYCSASANAYMGVDNPGRVSSGDQVEQARYNDVVLRQLTELWSNYGEVFEIWFDGGVVPPEEGGPDIVPVLNRLQPEAVVFLGPPECRSPLRWVGNERGEAPYPCWSAIDRLASADSAWEDQDYAGNPDGRVWAPAESDMPNRDYRKVRTSPWFWEKGEDESLYSVEHLVERYYHSVGRNTNLLLGMVIDDRGLAPEADRRQFESFGRAVRQCFQNRIASVSGQGAELEISLPSPTRIGQAVIMEDISRGERIRRYVLRGQTSEGWKDLAEGTCVGHKRIERFAPVEVAKIKLCIDQSADLPHVRDFSVYGGQ